MLCTVSYSPECRKGPAAGGMHRGGVCKATPACALCHIGRTGSRAGAVAAGYTGVDRLHPRRQCDLGTYACRQSKTLYGLVIGVSPCSS